MSEHTRQREPEQQQAASVTDLPNAAEETAPQHADQIKGGLLRRSGDDDLDEELEVER